MIPKIIHYVWVGNSSKSDLILKCIESWKKYCPDYKIKEWNNDDVAKIDKIAIDAGYKKAYTVSTKEELVRVLPEFISDKCTGLLEIKVKCGAREDLGRPKEKPCENKELFMEFLND